MRGRIPGPGPGCGLGAGERWSARLGRKPLGRVCWLARAREKRPWAEFWWAARVLAGPKWPSKQ